MRKFIMIIKCKKGYSCSDTNKDNCCLECGNFKSCEEPCQYLLDGETNKSKVLELCKYAN